MAYKIRVATRKEQLKKPDEFIGAIDRLGEFLRERSTLIGSILTVAVVSGAVFAGYWYYQERQKSRAADLEFQGWEYYRQESSGDAKNPPPSKEETYKKSIEEYQKVLQEYPGTPSAEMARYYIGNANMELKDYDAAIASYRGLTEKGSKNDILLGLTFQRIGEAYLQKKDLDAARPAFEAVTGLAGAINKDQADLALGRLDETAGQKEEAIKRYQEIVERYPDSMFMSEAQARLTALGVTNEKTPPPAKPEAESGGKIPGTAVPAPEPAQGSSSNPTEKK